MREAAQPSRSLRFGSFEVDLRAGELRKNGMKLRLTGQPFEVLAFLLERPGEVVTREEFQKRLWADTFVDFEHNLNTAINKIREVLGDSAESPRFVETLPRRGYRFIASVQGHPSTPARTSVVKWVGLAGVSSVALLAVVVSLHVGRSKENVLEGDRKPIRSLAVLPFANLSSDPEQDYFAEGTTEALITELGKIDGLRVISRQSTMQYRGTTKSASQIAHELNVEAIVEGSVIRAGDRVRISVQLIGAAPERHLWSNSYDRDLRDILAVHSEMAGAVASEVRANLTAQQSWRRSADRPVDPEAYQFWLKGNFLLSRLDENALKKAREFYEQAIQRDPNYAPAHAGLAMTWLEAGGWAWLG